MACGRLGAHALARRRGAGVPRAALVDLAGTSGRGERAVEPEQVLRDLRINRIFEGSTEIMHLMVAREAVDAHLKAAGDLAVSDADLSSKVRAAAGASWFYARWLPKLAAGKGTVPASYGEFGSLARHLRYVERSSRKLARQTFYGMSRDRKSTRLNSSHTD